MTTPASSATHGNPSISLLISDVHVLDSCVTGNVDVIEQGIALLDTLSDDDYQHVATPYVNSSIGEHFRHSLDLYCSLMNEQQTGIIDYDFRRRGAPVEACRKTALREFEHIKQWLLALRSNDIYRHVEVKTEVSLHQQYSEQLTSSMARELIFVAAHAIHHYALIRVSALYCNADVSADFGIAPATASYLRGQA
ncbi:DinB family protein [Photobacterium frigidiphilum]|uniref:DinB family protein n=1 Tax=Photobacterium frigidiphilum TaxID=264736 RepID=UPI003D14003A